MSSSAETEFRYYKTGVWQTSERCKVLPAGRGGFWDRRIRNDLIQIRFRFYKAFHTGEVTEDGHPNPIRISYDDPQQPPLLVADTFQPMISREKLLSNKPVYVERYKTKILSAKFGVPERKHAAIIRKIFQAIETAVPKHRIRVHAVAGTALLRGVTEITDSSTVDGVVGDMVIRRDQLITYRLIRDQAIFCDCCRTLSSQIIRPLHRQQQPIRPSNETAFSLHKFIPATKSSIESLEIVGLEESWKLAAICLRRAFEFDHPDADEEEAADAVDALLLTRLPCFHTFHRGCIVRWLQTSHLCPMCRYKMPQAMASHV